MLRSIELNRAFYNECVSKIIETYLPRLSGNHAAGLLGWGSEVLGNDDEFSKAYGWGPRVVIFVREEGYEDVYQALHLILNEHLPIEFAGCPTRFTDPANGPPLPTREKRGLPQVSITTCKRLIQLYLGVDSTQILQGALSPKEWLIISEDKLLRVTAGEIYYDGFQEISRLREACAYFPDDIWKYRLAYQWKTLSWDIDLIGLCAQRTDFLSAQLAIGDSVKRILRMIFLLNKRYAPGYLKWLHREFAKLPFLSSELDSVLRRLLITDASRSDEVLTLFYTIIDKLVEFQSKLLNVKIPDYRQPPHLDRGFFRYDLSPIIEDVRNQITGELRRISFQSGAIDQWVVDQDILMSPRHLRLLKGVYDSSDPEKDILIRMDRHDLFL